MSKNSKNEIVNKSPTTIFENTVIYILPSALGKVRLKLFQEKIVRNGGTVVQNITPDTTHIVVDETFTLKQVCKLLKLDNPPSIAVVKTLWLSSCLANQHKDTINEYALHIPPYISPEDSDTRNFNEVNPLKVDELQVKSDIGKVSEPRIVSPSKGLNVSIASSSRSGNFSDDSGVDSNSSTSLSSPEKSSLKRKYVCAFSSADIPVNQNKHITDKLQILADSYQNVKDRWRSLGYQKAIISLKNYSKTITTWEEARSVPGVGERLADKIMEIIQSGHLRKIDEVCTGERMDAINLFTKVWGAGPSTAEMWVQQGFRTLEDLSTKAKLTKHQEIGLKYYYELLDRMPREEAAKIETTVKNAALSFNPNLIAMACGSYRRGKSNCGDVDVLITHSDGKTHNTILPKVISLLHNNGFLTDDLVRHEENGNQKKYMGICKLPGESTLHRRLDVIAVPYDEFACALLYFTGSAYFNRSMRLLARRKGMALSEHSLNSGVMRKGQVKINEGYRLHTPTEESIFQHLGLEFRLPEERDH